MQILPSDVSIAVGIGQATRKLRDSQEAAVNAVVTKWDEADRLLGVGPTGSGKPHIFTAIAEQRRSAGPVLILAHRDELLEQARSKIAAMTDLIIGKEQAENWADLSADVVVASVQSLSQRHRLERFAPDHFRTVIVDEAKRTLGDSYLRILEYCGETKVVGVTATRDRADRRSLSRYYEAIAFEISLIQLIQEKWLCPIKVKTVPLAIDIRSVAMRAGDYSDSELAAALEPVLRELASSIKEHAAERKSLVFLPLVRTAYQLAGILREYGLAAEAIDGQSPDRKEILARFHSGQTRFLCNAMLLTEGYDEPSVDCIIPLRPTVVRSLYSQQIGRGTRTSPGKANLLIVDFLWLSREHDLVKAPSLIAKDQKEQAEIEAQLERADGDLLIAESLALSEREAALGRRLDERRHEQGSEIDLLELATRWHAPDIIGYQPTFDWERKPWSEKQGAILKRNGVDLGLVQNRGHAAALLTSLFAYLEHEPATQTQKRYCHFLGHPDPWQLTKREANRWIAQHKAQLTSIQERRGKYE